MLRVAFYSHDTYGLGHFRRCLKLAWALSERFSPLTGVFLSGSPWTDAFTLPPGFRVERLPPVVKVGRGRYAPRGGRLGLETLVSLRSESIRRLLDDTRPDLLLVDNVPTGLHGEVERALADMGESRPTAVLLLRDILDDPVAVTREWRSAGAGAAVERFFDEVWCFGDAHDVSVLLEQGPLVGTSKPVVACGHLGRSSAAADSETPHPTRDGRTLSVLVTTGGGADGGPLVEASIQALTRLPEIRSRVVLGPDFPHDVESRVRRAAPLRIVVERFVPDLERHIARADLVISMAGYNTVCEILGSGCRALLAPRSHPRREQLIRAERLAARGRATLLGPADLEPRRLAERIESSLAEPRYPAVPQPGGRRAADRAARLLDLALDRKVG